MQICGIFESAVNEHYPNYNAEDQLKNCPDKNIIGQVVKKFDHIWLLKIEGRRNVISKAKQLLFKPYIYGSLKALLLLSWCKELQLCPMKSLKPS